MSLVSPNFNYSPKQASLILSSFHRATGNHLISHKLSDAEKQRALFNADFCVVSHGVEEDPIFNYGNEAALRLFEFNWHDFIALPSRKSAEPRTQEERNMLLDQVRKNGFIDNYQGVRVSSSGNRFFVEEAVVWDILDTNNHYCGQAAVLYKISPITD